MSGCLVGLFGVLWCGEMNPNVSLSEVMRPELGGWDEEGGGGAEGEERAGKLGSAECFGRPRSRLLRLRDHDANDASIFRCYG